MSDNMDVKPSPGLNMAHGFVKHIEHHQIQRGQQVLHYSFRAKEDAKHRSEAAKLLRRVGMPAKSTKPTLELYRPPGATESTVRSKTQPKGLRNPESKSPMPSPPSTLVTNGGELSCSPKSDGGNGGSTSFNSGTINYHSPSRNGGSVYFVGINMPSNGGSVSQYDGAAAPPCNTGQYVGNSPDASGIFHGTGDGPASNTTTNYQNHSRNGTVPAEGSSDADASTPTNIVSYANIFEQDTAGFSKDIEMWLGQALEDPNVLPSQQLSEVGRVLCTRVVEDMKYYKTAARLCSLIIQKDSGAAFLGTVISCCQEWYLDREKLRQHNIALWVSYIRFLSEMFSFLRGRYHDAQILANLILECFLHMLKPPSLSINNFHELECLDSILFSLGRELQVENPIRMKELMVLLRDCFLELTIQSWARKILLQLIELQASGWELSPTAIKYYFDGSTD